MIRTLFAAAAFAALAGAATVPVVAPFGPDLGCITDSECEALYGPEEEAEADDSAASAPESDLPPAKIHA